MKSSDEFVDMTESTGNLTGLSKANVLRKSAASKNEVWRYKSWDGFGKSALITLGRGLKYAVVAMAVTIAIDKAFGLHNSQHSHNSDH
ncbi:hypothetical protein LSH36_78g00035 [Paralvinella palmiformis]|uniref:Uncharacterized protein n=1 Tax=Paralvinella palmiformis TaxID=53620 RepID=A0AAD9K2F5_9ANNE|nr:hypothetical protein LSH36_78g00035 [Paralvinella palmiformis]